MKTTATISVLGLGLLAGSATAGTAVASFTYSDLLGTFDANTGVYTAVAGSATAGDVTRLDSNPGSAEFDSGFINLPTDADYEISLLISNVGAGLADGNGSLTITDDNGDTLTADVSGLFRAFAGSVAFEGELFNASFNNNSGDGLFNGSTSGSFSTLFSTQPSDGSLVSLFFDPGAFFNGSFSNQITLASGLLVPAPGAAALLGLGGLVAARRRR